MKLFLTTCFLLAALSIVLRYDFDKKKEINFIKLSELVINYTGKKVNPIKLTKYLKHNFEICEKYGVDFGTNLAKIHIESRFNDKAVSKTGCVGLHQISRILCRHYKVSFKEVKQNQYLNSEIGIRYFAYLSEKYSIYEALLSYEQGETGAKTAISIYPILVQEQIENYQKLIKQSKQ